jgi:molybdenum cofactor cytidylyltransferase
VRARHIERLLAAFKPAEGRAICVPTFRGKRGNPVLFGRALFAGIAGIAGDVGARQLIAAHEDMVVEVAMEDDAVLTDIDTPEALARLRSAS